MRQTTTAGITSTASTNPYTLAFVIPDLPKPTNQNGGHWRSRHKESTKWINLVALAVRMTHVIPKEPIAKAKLTLIRSSSMEPDHDGLVSSFKHVIDGLVRIGVLENDKSSNIGQPVYLWTKTKPKKGSISVHFEEVWP